MNHRGYQRPACTDYGSEGWGFESLRACRRDPCYGGGLSLSQLGCAINRVEVTRGSHSTPSEQFEERFHGEVGLPQDGTQRAPGQFSMQRYDHGLACRVAELHVAASLAHLAESLSCVHGGGVRRAWGSFERGDHRVSLTNSCVGDREEERGDHEQDGRFGVAEASSSRMLMRICSGRWCAPSRRR